MNKSTILVLLLACLSYSVKAQYEHRFSATFSGGAAMTFSTVETVSSFDSWDLSDNDPAAFGNFEPSSYYSLGFHLNPGKRFALVINADIAGFNKWSYDYDYSFDEYKIDYNDRLHARKTSLGVAPRLYLNPRSGVRVYMQLKASLAQLSLIYENYFEDETRFLDNTMAIGVEPAFGLDIRAGERFGIFFQNSVEFNMFNESQFPTSFFDTWVGGDNSIDLQKDNLNMFKVELGLRYSFLKSKKI